MAQSPHDIPSTDHNQPPGTFLLIQNEIGESENHDRPQIILHPVPSRDPNEPLNWSTARKTVNFTLVLAVTVVVFTALSIQVIFWQLIVSDMNVTYAQLNNAMSVNFVGLSVGCVLFIPLAKKLGRRPVYLVSTAIMMAASFRSAWMKSLPELYITNLLHGLAGATNESIVQITVADLFFVHHRGGVNGLYMTMVMIGSFLTPMAAGTQATREGWRASYRALGIVNAVLFGLFIFFYEETKYTQVVMGVSSSVQAGDGQNISVKDIKPDHQPDVECTTSRQESDTALAQHHELDYTIPLKTRRQRLALVTYTAEPIWPYFYRPFVVLTTFPAILFCALQYALGVVWLTILSSVLGLVFPLPPYNFTPEQIGFMSVGPFVGNLLGSVYGGFLGDRSILFFARRNKGYYEPEMRLYILHLPALTLAGGLIMFGTTIARGLHWIWPSIAGALFGFGLGSISDAALTLVIDSYRDVSVAFLRNAISIGIPFAISPWLERSGAQDMFIACGFTSLAVTMTIIPMVLYGKKMRMVTAGRYRVMAGLKD
ncbi:putative MFS transporter [Aspergillus novofumigatus IBT 16806]|uniref:Putative MFS transporter n=1 Tax=Aspergillus novofumigatus (strain IBT 16806) TaxID=1392255 RepID=A0A2I1BW64_ASPN1|nr:putative MFS transporter [Aspergillus novofumigatus IBT 16806]PKX89624.1 putative MFS transporter [Aspergillus novofumigatus IBT 16806]